MNYEEIGSNSSFVKEKSATYNLKHAEVSQIKYDLVVKLQKGLL